MKYAPKLKRPLLIDQFLFLTNSRFISIIGNNPAKTIVSAGNAASSICDRDAYVYTWVASVSKLNGLNINVAGNSFIESTKTSKADIIKAGFIIGSCIFSRVEYFDCPKTREAAEISGFRVTDPDSIVP